nr:MAG TPA: hypothetical protein [Caudoviricetes sp.]
MISDDFSSKKCIVSAMWNCAVLNFCKQMISDDSK